MSARETTTAPIESMAMLLRALKLPSFSRYAEEIATKAEREGWSFGRYLHHLAEMEVEERKRRRIERYLKGSELPLEKRRAILAAVKSQDIRLSLKITKLKKSDEDEV